MYIFVNGQFKEMYQANRFYRCEHGGGMSKHRRNLHDLATHHSTYLFSSQPAQRHPTPPPPDSQFPPLPSVLRACPSNILFYKAEVDRPSGPGPLAAFWLRGIYLTCRLKAM